MIGSCAICGAIYTDGGKFCPVDGSVLELTDDDGKVTVSAGPALTRDPDDPLIGRTFGGRYELTGILGKGAMGAVYRANHMRMQREVAVKVILKGAGSNPNMVRRFLREVRTVAKLQCPHTITVHDFGNTEDGLLYLVMEKLEGQELADAVTEHGPMGWREATTLVSQILEALGEAHELGVVHRDMKPENVFLTRAYDGTRSAKVLDFGVARTQEAASEGLTQAGTICGTPEFMSPEQCFAEEEIDGRADIYCVGLIYWFMLAGRKPFDSSSLVEILKLQVASPAPPLPDEVLAEMPADLQTLLELMLEKDRENRPPDARTLREAIKQAVAGEPVEYLAGRADVEARRAAAAREGAIAALGLGAVSPPVAVRTPRSKLEAEIVAGDASRGLIVGLPPVAEGTEFDIDSVLDGEGMVRFSVRAGRSGLDVGEGADALEVFWTSIKATRHRKYLMAAITQVLGIEAKVEVEDDVLGPHRILVYDAATQTVRLEMVPGASRPGSRSRMDGRHRMTPAAMSIQPGTMTNRPYSSLEPTNGSGGATQLAVGEHHQDVSIESLSPESVVLTGVERVEGLKFRAKVRVALDAGPIGRSRLWVSGTVKSLRTNTTTQRIRLEVTLAPESLSRDYVKLASHWR